MSRLGLNTPSETSESAQEQAKPLQTLIWLLRCQNMGRLFAQLHVPQVPTEPAKYCTYTCMYLRRATAKMMVRFAGPLKMRLPTSTRTPKWTTLETCPLSEKPGDFLNSQRHPRLNSRSLQGGAALPGQKEVAGLPEIPKFPKANGLHHPKTRFLLPKLIVYLI